MAPRAGDLDVGVDGDLGLANVDVQLGIAPVIIADAWVPCEGPRWADFALFVPERELARLRGPIGIYIGSKTLSSWSLAKPSSVT